MKSKQGKEPVAHARVSKHLVEGLRRLAEKNRRSMREQMDFLIEQALKAESVEKSTNHL